MRAPEGVEGLLESEGTLPVAVNSVLARQDLEATEKAQEYFLGYPPSSPSAATTGRRPSSPPPNIRSGVFPEQLGDFRILRQVLLGELGEAVFR